MVNQAVDNGDEHSMVAEHLGMPQRLTGELLRYGRLIRIIHSTASAFLSAPDAPDGNHG